MAVNAETLSQNWLPPYAFAQEIPSVGEVASGGEVQEIFDSMTSETMTEEALERIYPALRQSAIAIAMRRGLEFVEAEESAQESIFLAWQKVRANMYDPEKGEFKPWFNQLSSNMAVDIRRHRDRPTTGIKIIPLSDRTEGMIKNLPDPSVDLEQHTLDSERDEIVQQAVRVTPNPEQRRVIELNFFQDIPHSQIVEIEDIPLGTVKGRVNLGVKKMRAYIKDNYPNYVPTVIYETDGSESGSLQ